MEIIFRNAMAEDLEQIVQMLADDDLGSTRERYENPLPQGYRQAFEAIDSDPNIELMVATHNGQVIGVLQLTFTPHITYQGGWRATIEGVRTDSSVRGKGVGGKMVSEAIERAKEKGCHLIQLTTDKKRPKAMHFYEELGFSATHEGMKLKL